MRLARVSWLVAILAVAAIEISCGDVFRPIAIPQNPNPPDPESLHFALVLTDNGAGDPGASSRIDVSGDTNMGTARVGIGPVHAALLPPNGGEVYIANRLEDTVSAYATSTATTVNTISLPAGSAPVFVHTTQSDTVYVANSGNATVSVISVGRNLVTQTIPVGINPIALAETPDGKKLYVVNQGSGTVTAINTIDKTVNATIPTGSNPILAAARSDNARIYVLNQGSGTVSVIDTLSDTVISSVPVGAANFMFYDKGLNRLYLTLPSSAQLAVINVGVDPPAALPNVDLTASCPGCVLDGVTALPNGLRAYVSSHQVSAACSHVDQFPDDSPPCITTRVSVILVPNDTVLRTVTTLHVLAPNVSKPDVSVVSSCDSVRFRRSIASSGDSSRVFIANCDAGGTDIIRTSDDTFVLRLPAPFSSAAPPPGQTVPPLQNPVFAIPGR